MPLAGARLLAVARLVRRFHSATCPEQALLKWVGHSGHDSLQGKTFFVVGADRECSACGLASLTLALVTASMQVLLLVEWVVLENHFTRVRPSFAHALSIARGPPFSSPRIK